VRRNFKLEKLQAGETVVTSEKGNSMVPLIYSGQEHTLVPTTLAEVEVGDIVYCKVRGNMYTHLVKAKQDERGVLIGNNHGYDNGWTTQVFGKVIEVAGVPYKR
jgi:phage repressor protein C with HTH and peptisase S24 domain